MTKKMKGVALDSSPFGSYEDAKASLKHQTLLQDYQELLKETEVARNKLEKMRLRKLTLSSEVRFLHRRRKFLLKKSLSSRQGQVHMRSQTAETQHKNNKKVQIPTKKEAASHHLTPIFNLNQKGRVYMEKKVILPNVTPVFDLNNSGKEAALYKPPPVSNFHHGGRVYRGKQVVLQKSMPVIDLNQKERIKGGNGAVLRKPAPFFHSNEKQSASSGTKAATQSRAPVFDLNQISTEEEEFQENCEPLRFEEPRKGLIRGGIDELHNDLKLSVCRNVGDGSPIRTRKRKISWQDPVALRV